jgi:GDP-4-dehydro-6-deoxy-D-mannose reductase
LVPDLYKKIQEAKTSGGVIKVGNLKTKRDYTDVRDVVKAYADMAIAKNLEDDLYNVCTGKSVAGEEILNLLLKKADVSGGVKVEQDPALIRPNDPEDIYGSNARLQKAVNWQPQIKLEQTIEDFVQYSKKS